VKTSNAPENQATRRSLPIACATALALALMGALPGGAQQVANEVMLINAKTGKCLTIAGGVSTANNVTSLQFDCDTDLSRRWTIRLKL